MAKSSEQPHFVVQEHHATHLHYDFRLECHGVLLSWAVPKGPSLDPHDKRLAIHVEDHPLDYQYFEGEIPPGSYGAGTVKIWDHGWFTTPEATTKKEIENNLAKGFSEGKIAVILHGKKLHGEYDLVKMKNDEKGKSWLLMKKA